MNRTRSALASVFILVGLVAFWPVTFIAVLLWLFAWALQDAAQGPPEGPEDDDEDDVPLCTGPKS